MGQIKAEEKFQGFDWSNKDWHKYLDGLFPTPGVDKIEHYKRKWFRANVDSQLSDGKSTKKETNSTTFSASTSQPTQQTRTVISLLHTLSYLSLFAGCCLSIIYILPLSSAKFKYYAIMSYAAGFLITIYREHGFPKFQATYIQRIITDQSCQCLLMTFASYSIRSWVSLVSPFITSLIILATESHMWLPQLPAYIQTHSRLNSYLQLLKTQQYQVSQVRSTFEVVLGFSLILMLFMRSVTLLTIILYWNALRFKYQADPYTQASFRQIDVRLCDIMTSPYCPIVIFQGYCKIKQYLQYMMTTAS